MPACLNWGAENRGETLQADDSPGAAELERALTFFRGVRADAFAHRCEMLLAA